MPKLIDATCTETEIYRRHRSDCKKHDRCDCPWWIYGYVKGERIRESLKTTRADIAVDRQRRREGRATATPEPLPDSTVAEAIEKFLEWSTVSNSLAKSTGVQYVHDLKAFASFCAGRGIKSIREVTKEVISGFVVSLSKYAATTRVVRFAQLRALFGYLHDNELVAKNPLPRRGPRRPKHGAHRPLDRSEQKKILAACNVEERALMLVLLTTGLRGVDVRALKWSNLDFKKRMLCITPQKTSESSGVEVMIPSLPVELFDALRALPRPIDSEAVFPKWENNRQMFLRVIAGIMARAGVDATAHDCRCTFSVERLEEGAMLYDVSLLLGHSSVATTQRYYAKWENRHALALRLGAIMDRAQFSHLQRKAS